VKEQLTKCGIDRAAEILDKSVMATYQDVYRGRIPYRRLGRKIFFFEQELREFLERQPGVSLEQAIGARK
jgi:hypothetical protein